MKVSVILPAYNEQDNIAQVCVSVKKALEQAKFTPEIIIVDDGSSDNTLAVVQQLRYDCIIILRHKTNMGYGAAIRSGNHVAEGDVVCWMDSDGQYNAENLMYMIPLVKQFDLVVGHRTSRADPLGRRFAAAIWNLVSKMVLGPIVPDLDCGFKVYNKQVSKLANLVRSNGNAFNVEFIYLAHKIGHKIGSISVDNYPRVHGSAKGFSLMVGLTALRDLAKIKMTVESSIVKFLSTKTISSK